jgi:hypothetical protein
MDCIVQFRVVCTPDGFRRIKQVLNLRWKSGDTTFNPSLCTGSDGDIIHFGIDASQNEINKLIADAGYRGIHPVMEANFGNVQTKNYLKGKKR